ncbi:hypothetical protein RGQ29_030200 [Quercus rubra]|uniref:Uncharacterized protein n=1 Tax=Quercus rubra TaxID=3512 RepID=A0AAN7EHD7_QUERU|nr:hypothetical protein RGQ29_030200 [Quercus rubra]
MDSSCKTGSWTNEKHFHFLNSMEASFVRTMFDNNNNNNNNNYFYNNNDPILRLDRYLPDSSDSTLDLKKHRNKKLVKQGVGYMGNNVKGARAKLYGKTDKRTRRVSSQPSIPPQDQVVPHLESRRTGGDKD